MSAMCLSFVIKCFASRGWVVLVFISANLASAQPFLDVVDFRIQQFPTSEKTTTEYVGSVFVPIELANGNYFIVGSAFNRLSFDAPLVDNLSAVSLHVGGIKKWNEKWRTMLLVMPKVSSDFVDISSQDMQIGGVNLNTLTVRDGLEYKFGLYANREFFGLLMMPLLGIDWRVNDKLNVFGILPGSMNVEYQVTEKCYTGLSYKSTTASYRLSESLANSYVREGDPAWGHMQVKTFVHFYPGKMVVLYAEVGHTAFRTFDIYAADTKDQMGTYSGFKDSFIFSIGSAVRVRMPNR